MGLRWMLNDVVVDGSTLLPGKRVHLDVYRPSSPPAVLQTYQVYSSAMRQILKHVGVPDQYAGPQFGVVRTGNGYRSDRPWRLPEPRGWRKSATFVFVDAADPKFRRSGRLHSSRVGTAKIKGAAGLEVKEPTGTVPLGASTSNTIEIDFVFARDPTLTVEVLTGDRLAEHMLRNLTQDVARADEESADLAARIELSRWDLTQWLEDAYRPPRRWRAESSTRAVRGGEGDHSKIEIEVETPVAGTGYFAVTLRDPSDPDAGETSDVWAIKVDPDGQVTLVLDLDDMPLPMLPGDYLWLTTGPTSPLWQPPGVWGQPLGG